MVVERFFFRKSSTLLKVVLSRSNTRALFPVSHGLPGYLQLGKPISVYSVLPQLERFSDIHSSQNRCFASATLDAPKTTNLSLSADVRNSFLPKLGRFSENYNSQNRCFSSGSLDAPKTSHLSLSADVRNSILQELKAIDVNSDER